ncbi:MAG: TIGR03663 family protein [Chloroflexi bacterium]|nr:TIGR03663 family protein [Chloroflexota bacterium]
MALVEERVSSPRRRVEAPLSQAPAASFPLEPVLYLVLIAIGFLLRIYQLDARALHHDESLHALYSWYLYVGRGYVHDPMMHGPFQFHLTALIYFLFGDSDFTARLAPVLFGTAAIGLPFFLRHELGRRGALIAALLLTISPSFLYFSRFVRNDIYIGFWTLLLVVGIFGYLRTASVRYVYVAAVALALSFATKEVTYITGLIVVTFALLALLVPGGRAQVLPALRAVPLKVWLGAAGLFLAINVVLYTTFFTNPKGLCTALVSVGPLCGGAKGALNYWLEQHDVQRGGQPVYYYVMLLALYEFLPALLAFVGTLALWRRGTLFFWFLVYWSLAAFGIYSQAGEKMPWLLVNLALPLILLTALFLGHVADRLDWGRLRNWHTLAAASLGLVLVASAAAWLNLGAAETLMPLETQAVLLRRVGLGLVMAAAVGGLAHLWARQGRALVLPSVAGAFGLGLLFLYVHVAWTVTYTHGDTPSEPLVYVQSSPDVPWIMHEIERIGFQYGERKNVGLLLDNGWGDGQHESVAWPFEWYLRDYTNKRYFTRTIGPEVDLSRYPVLLVMASNLDPIRPVLDQYHGQKYRLNWWFPEEYKNFDASQRVGPVTIPWLKWDQVFARLANPVDRANLLKFFIYRDMPSGGAREMYFYVRNDVPALGPGPFLAAPSAPAPAAEARETIAQPGPNGATIFGRTAAGKSVLVEPKDVAVDASGRLYVVESRAHRVTVFNPDGTIAASWGRQGSGDGEFNEPWGIALAPNGEVLVADTWNHRIQRFTADGKFLGKWGRLYDPQKPVDQQVGAFWGPRDVAVAPDGTVYVTDTGNKRVEAFDLQGNARRAFGSEGNGEGQFREPVGLALDAQGNLLVADTWNNRVQRVDPQGRFLGAYPLEGWDSTSVANKPYLAARGQQVLVTQPERGRVLVLDEQGKAEPLQGATSLQLPTGIAVDPSDQVYVVESRTGTVVRLPR